MRIRNAVLVVMVCMIIVSRSNGFAAGVSLPFITKEKPKAKIGIAAEVEYAQGFDRDLKCAAGEKNTIETLAQAHGKVSFARYEEFQPYVKFGMARFQENLDNIMVTGLGNRNIEIDFADAFSYGGGCAGAFRLPRAYLLGYDLQYLRSRHDPHTVRHNGDKASYQNGEALIQEWHSALWAGRLFDIGKVADVAVKVLPYIGGRVSELKLKMTSDIVYAAPESLVTINGSTKTINNGGVFVGILAEIGNSVQTKIEGRFIDETALSLSAAVRF